MVIWNKNSQAVRAVGRYYDIYGESWLKGISEERQFLWWCKLFLLISICFILFVICFIR